MDFTNENDLYNSFRKGGLDENKATQFWVTTYHNYSINTIRKKFSIQDCDADALFFDALFTVVQNIREGRFRRDSKIKTYFFSILNRLCLNELKDKYKTVHVFEGYPMISEDVLIEDPSELKKLIQKALLKISKRCREILNMWSLDSYSAIELAEMLDYKDKSVSMTKKSHCLSLLKSRLREDETLFKALKMYL